MTRPNFLYIGIARAGSTWLFEALKHHPQIYVPPAKDLYFFDKYYDKGMGWYEGFFSKAGSASAIGEMSHDYYFSEEAANRIKADLPGVKLILCLREPIARLRSGYAYNQTTDLDDGISLAAYARRPEIKRQFDFYSHVNCYLDLFGPEQLLVVFYEDLNNDPVRYIRTIYSFLGVKPDFVPPSLFERINAARDARSESLALLAYRIALILRKLGMANLVGYIKQNALVNRVLYQPGARKGFESEGIPPEIVTEFRKNNKALEKLISRRLPESWYG